MRRKKQILLNISACLGIALFTKATFFPAHNFLGWQAYSRVIDIEIHDTKRGQAFNGSGLPLTFDTNSTISYDAEGEGKSHRSVKFRLDVPRNSDVRLRLAWQGGSANLPPLQKEYGFRAAHRIVTHFPVQESDKSVHYALSASGGVWQTQWRGRVGVDTEHVKWVHYAEIKHWEARVDLHPRSGIVGDIFQLGELRDSPLTYPRSATNTSLSFSVPEQALQSGWVTLNSQTFRTIKSGFLAFGKPGDVKDQVRPSNKVSLIAINGDFVRDTSRKTWAPNGELMPWIKPVSLSYITDHPPEKIARLLFDLGKQVNEYRSALICDTQGVEAYGGTMRRTKDLSIGKMESHFVGFPKGVQSADFTFLLGTGAFSVLSQTQTKAKTETEMKANENSYFVDSQVYEDVSVVTVLVKSPASALTKFTKVVAYDQKGDVCSNDAYGNGLGVDVLSGTLHIGYKPEDVARVELWVMDTEKHTFKNVPLEPNK